MAWPLRFLPVIEGQSPFERKRPIGSLWYMDVNTDRLSSDYLQHRAGQPMLWVELPGGPMPLDMRSTDGSGWVVTGEPPTISVTPSINQIGHYHGYITDGVLGDDVEGRGY